MGYEADEPTEEELKLLAADEQNATVPPAEDDDANPITPEQVAAEQGLTTTGEPVAPPAPAGEAPAAPVDPTAAPAAPAGQTDADRRAAFLAQHKDKTPEQLLDLAFQQQARANQAGFTARQSKEQLQSIQERATAAIQRAAERRAKLGTDREAFQQQLQDDPDAATRAVHDRLMSEEEREIAREEHTARREAAVGMATAAIPGFDMTAAAAFGAEMNYTPDEIEGITDPRDIVTLHFASLTGRLVKAGIMDMQGNLLQQPSAVAATDPRLTAPAPVTTLSSAPARGTEGGQTLEKQLTDITNMTDAQMDELERTNPGLIESLLRKAG